jgi:alpha-glucosidase (family GH31 glycosyl hydrolase)
VSRACLGSDDNSKWSPVSADEVIGVAKNFSSLNLSVGVIVIDLGPPADPPYYRLDPARFPDVAAMAAQVKALTGGAYLMPNLKPTSVKSSDCPACDAGHSHATDGKADDGKVDASSAACRQCIWNKRLKPALFDKNVTTFWLDDDEANKFKLEGQQCKPTNGAARVASPQTVIQIPRNASPSLGGCCSIQRWQLIQVHHRRRRRRRTHAGQWSTAGWPWLASCGRRCTPMVCERRVGQMRTSH